MKTRQKTLARGVIAGLIVFLLLASLLVSVGPAAAQNSVPTVVPIFVNPGGQPAQPVVQPQQRPAPVQPAQQTGGVVYDPNRCPLVNGTNWCIIQPTPTQTGGVTVPESAAHPPYYGEPREMMYQGYPPPQACVVESYWPNIPGTGVRFKFTTQGGWKYQALTVLYEDEQRISIPAINHIPGYIRWEGINPWTVPPRDDFAGTVYLWYNLKAYGWPVCIIIGWEP